MGKLARAALVLCALAASLFALDLKSLKPQGYVSDFANVLDPQSRAQLEAYCGQVEQTTGVQMAMVTIQSLDGEPIEDVSNTLFRQWGVGKKGKDEGIMLLLAVQDHRDRIEVGYGLEPILPDGFDGSILRGIQPLLRQGAYGQAMIAAAEQMAAESPTRKASRHPDQAQRPRIRRPPNRTGLPWPVIVIGIVVLLFLFRGGGREAAAGPAFLTGMILGNLLGGGRGRERLGWRRLRRRRWWRRFRRIWRRRFGRRRRFGQLVTPSIMEDKLQELVDRLKHAQRERLRSVVLYGSAASGEHNEHFSDINVLCVLTAVTPAELADSEPIFNWWRAHGNPSPLLLSEEEVRTLHRLFSHRISRHAGAPARAVRRRCHSRSGDRREVLSRASGDGAAVQAATPASESRRSPLRQARASSPDDRFRAEFPGARAACPAGFRHDHRLAQARNRPPSYRTSARTACRSTRCSTCGIKASSPKMWMPKPCSPPIFEAIETLVQHVDHIEK